MGPRTLISRGEQCGRWAGQTGCATCTLCNPLQSLSSYLSYPFSSYLGLKACCLIEVLWHTQVPLISIEELVLRRHACCILSHLHCNGHSLLFGFYLSRIGRIENLFCSTCRHSSQDTSSSHVCTAQVRTLCAAHSLATLCLFTTSGPDPGELPSFWGCMVFCHAPISWKESGKQQQQLKGLTFLCKRILS